MNFEEKIPDWDNVGVEPDAQMKKDGFKAGYKPPAAYKKKPGIKSMIN